MKTVPLFIPTVKHFSSLQMVYPFETAAYSTEKGNISEIVRARFGYHILKVTDKKPSLEKVQVAHIMIRSSDGMIAEDTLKAYRKIQEIYSQNLFFRLLNHKYKSVLKVVIKG